jgi:hypothetical protein
MDASKIIELRQKQANTYINRSQQAQDASLITWQKQIAASRYLPETHTASPAETSNPQNLGGCKTCGGSSTVNIMQNSTVSAPNPMFSSKGSGSQIYSSDFITYKRAGDQACGTATVNSITEPSQLFIQLPKCFCNEVNRYQIPAPPSDQPQNIINPYLPFPQPYIANTVAPVCNCTPIHHVNSNCCNNA